MQKLFSDYNQLQEASRNIEATLFRERGEWVEQKANFIKEIEELQQSQSKLEQDKKVLEEIDHLRKENRDLKEIIESGGAGKASNDSMLLQRLENYRMRL